MAQGIDVSHYQSTIDWPKVKASGKVEFAILKASEGISLRDSQFATNRKRAAEVGIPATGYHFHRPQYDAEQQADFFYGVVGAIKPGEIIPWIDVEFLFHQKVSDLAAATQNLALLVMHCEERFGKPIGIYTAAGAWNPLPHENRFGHLPLWVASWGGTMGKPVLPESWSKYAVHQYTSSGAVSGIAGNVDLNYTPNLDAIRKLIPVPPPPPAPQSLKQSIAAIRAELDTMDRLVAKL